MRARWASVSLVGEAVLYLRAPAPPPAPSAPPSASGPMALSAAAFPSAASSRTERLSRRRRRSWVRCASTKREETEREERVKEPASSSSKSPSSRSYCVCARAIDSRRVVSSLCVRAPRAGPSSADAKGAVTAKLVLFTFARRRASLLRGLKRSSLAAVRLVISPKGTCEADTRLRCCAANDLVTERDRV